MEKAKFYKIKREKINLPKLPKLGKLEIKAINAKYHIS